MPKGVATHAETVLTDEHRGTTGLFINQTIEVARDLGAVFEGNYGKAGAVTDKAHLNLFGAIPGRDKTLGEHRIRDDTAGDGLQFVRATLTHGQVTHVIYGAAKSSPGAEQGVPHHLDRYLVLQVGHAAELFGNKRGLPLRLVLSGDVLEVTATASVGVRVGARCLDAVLAGGNDVDGVAAKKLGSLFGEFDSNTLTGNGVADKDGSSVSRVGHRSTIGDALNQHFFTIEHWTSLEGGRVTSRNQGRVRSIASATDSTMA